MDIWKYCMKDKTWVVNAAKLTLAADLFACVAPKPEEESRRLTRWQLIGNVVYIVIIVTWSRPTNRGVVEKGRGSTCT